MNFFGINLPFQLPNPFHLGSDSESAREKDGEKKGSTTEAPRTPLTQINNVKNRGLGVRTGAFKSKYRKTPTIVTQISTRNRSTETSPQSSTRSSTQGSSKGSSRSTASSTKVSQMNFDPYSEDKKKLSSEFKRKLAEYKKDAQERHKEVTEFLKKSKSTININQEMADQILARIRSTNKGMILKISGLEKRVGPDVIVTQNDKTVKQFTFRDISDEVEEILGISMRSPKRTPMGRVMLALDDINAITKSLLDLEKEIIRYTTEGKEAERQRARAQDKRDNAIHGGPVTRRDTTKFERFLGAPNLEKLIQKEKKRTQEDQYRKLQLYMKIGPTT